MRAHTRNQAELARGPAPQEWARIDPTIYVTAARHLQAQAMAETLGAGWRGMRRGLTGLTGLVRRHLVEPIRTRAQRQRALANLAALDDRLLADIGLRRGDLELAVDGCLADPRVTRAAPAPIVLSERRLERDTGSAADSVVKSDQPDAPAHQGQAPDLAA